MNGTLLSVSSIAQSVATGACSAVAQAQDALARADRYAAIQPQAWITRVAADEVLAQARRVDARIAAGDALPLAGVPFAVKDNIDAAGLPTTVACPAFAYSPGESATVVQRLIEAGALLIGKTNLDQFATGLVGTRSPYGVPACVFNRDYVSGGSSSGSAVVTAAGVVAFALGTDTAGSGRVPAAFNGLFGFKPTRGRWSTLGVFPACRSIDCVTVFAADAQGAALVDMVLAAFDARDPYGRRAPDAPAAALRRIGVARAGQLRFLGDAQSEALFAQAVRRARDGGAELVDVDIAPLLAAAQLLYAGPWIAERVAALGSFLREQPGAVHPVVRAIVQAGAGVSGVEVFEGQYRLQEYLRHAERMWQDVDALLLPTAPTIYRIGELLAEPVVLNSNLGLYTNFVNLLDMSAVSVPAGYRDNGTGFGVSLIGPAWADRALLDLAARVVAPAPRPPLDLGEPDGTAAANTPIALAVVGAHLHGQPLHWQLTSRGARLVCSTHTANAYRLYAMAGPPPARPALVRRDDDGCAIAVEVYELDVASFGSFVAQVQPPLAIGSVELADGRVVKGFVAEPRALEGATDVSALGGWRAYLAQSSACP